MRHVALPAIGLAAVLSGCHGSTIQGTPTASPPPPTYSIGGSVAGLSGTVVLQNNGGDNLTLSSNGTFAFAVTLQPDSAYRVTVATQPANQACSVSHGSGTATASVTNVTVVCSLSSTTTDVWTWAAGAASVNAPGVYGTKGSAAATMSPVSTAAKARPRSATCWEGAIPTAPGSTRPLWLFGGVGFDSTGTEGYLNDLWQYNPSTGN